MRLSAIVCREQEILQRQIAENDPLENRRKIADAAATAWSKEATEADNREARELKRRTQLETEAALQGSSVQEVAVDAR